MTVEIKDKNKVVSVALRAAGYNVDQLTVETILNISDYVRENIQTTTLRDIVEIQKAVEGLFNE